MDDIQNPYRNQHDFDFRFMFTLNKIYAWTLTEYQRVVMLDADNLFLRAPDELFQCGQFCAVFINPCIFHTGLFVLQARFINYFLTLTLSLLMISDVISKRGVVAVGHQQEMGSDVPNGFSILYRNLYSNVLILLPQSAAIKRDFQ